MKRKTYGVSGLMDWTTQIKAGRGTVSVHFSGGALTAYGVTPATFSTANPFFQNIIEGCDHYRTGRIKLLGEIDLGGDEPKKTVKANAATAATAETPKAETTAEENAKNTAESADVQKVEVADRADAIEWLKQYYPEKGYGAAKLRTKSAFDSACKECNVEFIYPS